MAAPSVYLDWDSEFFRKKIAHINLDGLTPDETVAEMKRLKRYGCDIVYLTGHSQVTIIGGFTPSFANIKRIYVLNRPCGCGGGRRALEYDGAADSLYPLAYQAGHCSRFNLDPNFSKEDFERLYRRWVDNSISGGMADRVFVSLDDYGKPVGLITGRINTDCVEIGLFAVDKACRGHGIGRNLMQHIESMAQKAGLPIEVATQAENSSACRFYESVGFEIKEQIYTYHVWLDR